MPSRQAPDDHRVQNRFQRQHLDYLKSGDAMSSVCNPRYDYSFNFIETGEYPQNFVLNDTQAERYRRYPKMETFVSRKRQHIEATNHPAMFLKCCPSQLNPIELKSHFDVILIEPPLMDYKLNLCVNFEKLLNWDEIEQLPVDQLAAPRSFVWLWCGSIEGLNRGRECLKKWGFRRCEDICWIKTNKGRHNKKSVLEHGAIFHRTKEHCLMGIKGTVKRSLDGDFIHANVDVDVILAEQDPDIPDKKPEEMFSIIENFCLGRRRLHLFGRDHSVRPGWLTVGLDLMISNFDADQYSAYFNHSATGHLTGSTAEIENMRPKSPPPKEPKQVPSSGAGMNSDPQVRTADAVNSTLSSQLLHGFQQNSSSMTQQTATGQLQQQQQLMHNPLVLQQSIPTQHAAVTHLPQNGGIVPLQHANAIQQQAGYVLLQPQQSGSLTQQQQHLGVQWQSQVTGGTPVGTNFQLCHGMNGDMKS